MSSQAKKDKLNTLGYTGSINDQYLKWLLDRGAVTKIVNQAEREFLIVKGFTTGSNNDRWNLYLRSLTYTGTRDDMEDDFWKGVNSN